MLERLPSVLRLLAGLVLAWTGGIITVLIVHVVRSGKLAWSDYYLLAAVPPLIVASAALSRWVRTQ